MHRTVAAQLVTTMLATLARGKVDAEIHLVAHLALDLHFGLGLDRFGVGHGRYG